MSQFEENLSGMSNQLDTLMNFLKKIQQPEGSPADKNFNTQ